MIHTTTHNFIITIKFQGTSVFGLSLTPDLSKAVDLKIELLGVHTNRESHLQRLSLPIKMGMEELRIVRYCDQYANYIHKVIQLLSQLLLTDFTL